MADGKGSGLAENLDRAERALAQFKGAPVRHFIAGHPADGGRGKTFDILCPVDNTILAKVAAGHAADIDAAAQGRCCGFPAWRAVPGARRRVILHAIADAIVARAEEIALIESMDTGQPIRYMAKAALRGADNYRFFAGRAPGAGDGLALPDTDHLNYNPAPAHRPRRHCHAVEYPVHALKHGLPPGVAPASAATAATLVRDEERSRRLRHAQGAAGRGERGQTLRV
jgi:hypothetical protein